MSIWGKTDTLASTPKFLTANTSAAPQHRVNNAVFVDLTEAAVASNRAAGLGTPGWYSYITYTDAQGRNRRKAECLVPMKVTAAAAGDLGVTGSTTTEDGRVPDA
jgi:hypothetical protein